MKEILLNTYKIKSNKLIHVLLFNHDMILQYKRGEKIKLEKQPFLFSFEPAESKFKLNHLQYTHTNV